MTLTTNGINIDNLPIKILEIKPKTLDEYRKETAEMLKKIKEDAKNGIAIFRDN